MTYSVEVENKLEMSRRVIHVHRKSREQILDQQVLGYPGNEYEHGERQMRVVSISIGAVEGEEDYVEISLENQQGDIGPCKIRLSPIVPFRFNPGRDISLIVIPPEQGETGTTLKIPSGPPTWKLEIMKPISVVLPRGDDSGGMTNVTVSDDDPGERDYI